VPSNSEHFVSEATLDVVGIGNAIVDVLAHVDESFLAENGFDKGIMTLIDEDQAQSMYAKMGPAVEASGGSAANTIAGIAALGGKAGFIGRVHNDQLGEVFAHDIRSVGVAYATPLATDGRATARSFVMVTPDAKRTMMTFLGASTELTSADIDPALIASAKVTYLEGYLWDDPNAKAAISDAAKIAHAAGRKVALSLSDPFCVERHRDTFLELISDQIDILFANRAEITSLFQTGDFEEAARRVAAFVEVAALTASEAGSVVVASGRAFAVSAARVARVVDTTGAGDLYASGFLYGYTQGKDWSACATVGGICAGEVIGHLGARPEVSLAELVRKAGF